MSRNAFVWFLSVVGVCLVGCDSTPELGIVNGTIKAGDKPLEEVMVYFMPEPGVNENGMMSSALTDKDGRYSLTYSHPEGGEGAEIGWHLITFKDFASENFRGKGPPPSVRIPKSMRRVGDTPFRFEVTPGEQAIDIDLKSP